MTTNLNVILNSFLQDLHQLGQQHKSKEFNQLWDSIQKAFGLTGQELMNMLDTL